MIKKFLAFVLTMLFASDVYAALGCEYDEYGNLVKIDRGGGSYSEYVYDENGQRTSHVTYNSNGTVKERAEYTYDEDGKATANFYNANNVLTSTETYRKAGDFRRVDYGPAEGQVTKTTYDSAGNVTEIIESFYDENGLNIGYDRKRPNGTVYKSFSYSYDYDQNGNITARYINGSLDYTYEYDEYGNLMTLRTGNGSLSRSYTFSDPNWRENLANLHSPARRRGRLIYTVDEAAAVSKDTGNKFKIRYQ